MIAQRGIDETQLQYLLMTYPLNLSKLTQTAQNEWQFQSKRGVYGVVVAPHLSSLHRMRAADLAARHRIRNVPRPLMNVYGDRLLRAGNSNVLSVSRFPSGVRLSVTPEDVRDAALQVARLHTALCGWSEMGSSSSDGLPLQYGLLERRVNSLKEWLATERTLTNEKNDIHSRVWAEWLDRWMHQVLNAEEGMASFGVRELAKRAEERQDVAWGCQWRELYRLQGGDIWIGQPADPLRAERLLDLLSITEQVCASGHPEGVMEAVESYHSKCPISMEEQMFILLISGLPECARVFARRRHQAGDDDEWRSAADRHHRAAAALMKRALQD